MSQIAPATLLALPTGLLDQLAEPLLVFDTNLRLQYANRVALRALHVEPGMGLADVEVVLSPAQRERLRAVMAGPPTADLPVGVSLGDSLPTAAADADAAPPQFWRIDGQYSAVFFPRDETPHRPAASVPAPSQVMGDAALRQLHGVLWSSSFPVMLQDEVFRLLDVNPAFEAMVGRSRAQLIGRDPLELLDAAGQLAALTERAQLERRGEGGAFNGQFPAQTELRLRDLAGQTRQARAVRQFTVTEEGRRLLLTVMQDTTAEHAAREQAERSARELDQWFDLNPLGLALFDGAGLVLRSNQAFTNLVGMPLVELRAAPPAVRELLRLDELSAVAGPGWSMRRGELPLPGGQVRWVRAVLRRHDSRAGQRRTLCVLEDRSVDQQLDLAQHQLGALVGSAGVSIVTFASGQGGAPVMLSTSGAGLLDGAVPVTATAAPAQQPAPAAGSGRGAALQGIRRDLIAPASLPDYERLQRALREGAACEVRFAIVHPELGERWLFSRVEPGKLSSGQASVSVVTLDITEQQLAHQRAEHLLGELTTILETSPAGIAALRGDLLTQCNQRFEHMLGLAPGSALGGSMVDLLARHLPPGSGVDPAQALPAALAAGRPFECELLVTPAVADACAEGGAAAAAPSAGPARGGPHWYALTVRRSGPLDEPPQAIAVLVEISRLKAQQAELDSLADERAGMAEVLGQQLDRTRAVLDSVLVGIVTVDSGGSVSWLNRSARRMFGGDLGDFIGQPIAAAATDEVDHPLRAAPHKLAELSDGEAQQFECRLRGRDGRVFWVVGNVVATLAHQGGRELTYAFLDIDQRRQAESRVAAARESLQRIIEAAPMAIALFDANELGVVQLNQVAAGLFDIDANQAVGGGPDQLWPPLLAVQLRADLESARLCQADAPLQREYRLRRNAPRRSPAAGANAEQVRQVWDARFLPLARQGERAGQILMVASDVTTQRAAQQAELEAAIAQREMLVQEVHHRIKNNLQGVAGLLQQVGQRRPEVRPVIAEVVSQVQAIAQVYGLQVGGVGPLGVHNLLEAIAGSLQRNFGRRIVLMLPPLMLAEGPSIVAAPAGAATSPVIPALAASLASAPSTATSASTAAASAAAGTDAQEAPVGGWTLPEAESIPIALTLNELITNAIKHSPADSDIECRLDNTAAGVSLSIANIGQLPEGFRIESRPSTVSGLGLVRSLLPRRNASLHFVQSGNQVVATVMLAAPVVRPARRALSGRAGG
ncbi:MAG: hypothetical protein RIQ60_647 [Pseudomonadota bacterium]|jgi:PAS domain S-box-containing protein